MCSSREEYEQEPSRILKSLESGGPVQSYLLFEFEDEASGSSPATLRLEDALVVQEDALQRLGGRGLLRARVLGHLLHQDVVTRVGLGEDAVGVLGLRQRLNRRRETEEEGKINNLKSLSFQIEQFQGHMSVLTCWMMS